MNKYLLMLKPGFGLLLAMGSIAGTPPRAHAQADLPSNPDLTRTVEIFLDQFQTSPQAKLRSNADFGALTFDSSNKHLDHFLNGGVVVGNGYGGNPYGGVVIGNGYGGNPFFGVEIGNGHSGNLFFGVEIGNGYSDLFGRSLGNAIADFGSFSGGSGFGGFR